MTAATKLKSAKPKKAPRVPKANGRPAYVATDEHRGEVRTLAGVGFSRDAIADYLDIDAKTVDKHFGDDIRKAKPRLIGAAYDTIAHHLKAKDLGAAKYVLSTKGKDMGWTPRVEVALPKDVFGGADPTRLTDKQWSQFVELLAIMGVDLMQHYPSARGDNARLIGSSSAV